MGIEQRMASSGEIAKYVGITTHERVESKVPISAISKGTTISRAKVKKKADVGGAVIESVKNAAIGLVFPPSLLVTYPKTIEKVVTEAEKEDPVLALQLKELGEGAYAGGIGTLGVPALVVQTAQGLESAEIYKEKLAKEYPDIPVFQEISYTMPEIKMPEIKIPNLLPDFSGVGKWLLIAGGILAAIMIIPALISRRRS